MNLDELQQSMMDLSKSINQLFTQELEDKILKIGPDNIKEIHYVRTHDAIENAYLVNQHDERVWNVRIVVESDDLVIKVVSAPVLPVT